ncbi:type IX secretion system PorP/SprF family membrane protein [Catalinimonas alkaloidigena]|nr:type IX secretion system PorP/SprF family membrane protein [Catalinimonas alkaloidigena]
MFISFGTCYAQQVPVSQYFVLPINVNPALIGSSTHPLIATHHRSQWNTFSNAYPIYSASLTYPIIQKYPRRSIKGGLGLKFSREVAGAKAWLKFNEIQIAGAYNLPLDYKQQHVISFGIATSLIQRSIDPDNLQWGSQYDSEYGYDPNIVPSLNLMRQGLVYVTTEAGAVWSYNAFKNQLLSPWQWLGGISIAHMNRPDISFTNLENRLPLLLKWHTGISYAHNNWKVHPQTIMLWQDTNYHLSIGSYFQYEVLQATVRKKHKTILMGGLWYRWDDAIAVSGGVLYNNLQFAFSADFSHHPTINYSSTGYAWEASLIYTLKSHNQLTKKRYTPLI